MPELPEVETIRLGLEPILVGRRLVRVEARRPDLRAPLPPDFVERLAGARVDGLRRRAKYMLAPLDRGETLIVHLGMSGRFVVGAAEDPTAGDPPHGHVVFVTDAGRRLLFVDPRRFGLIDLVATARIGEDPRLVGLGPEPLGSEFTADHLRRAFAGSRQPIKARLLDQRVIAGLGNIYACEALHGARIHPAAAAGEIGPPALGRLVTAVRKVLLEAIAAGGSTLRDFAHADGGAGAFQHDFAVYDRAGQPCPRRGCGGTIARIVQAGRSTFFCPGCQG